MFQGMVGLGRVGSGNVRSGWVVFLTSRRILDVMTNLFT